uniref:Uncharacterized protein n=1 Tax=Siphoviridae sp. ctKcB20 TaxID=2827568 RepID=A0A8S5LLM8_9CAUD|nr:MAG TPA: hypothetical protein [Siphoviridae sp. ctKcB20]
MIGSLSIKTSCKTAVLFCFFNYTIFSCICQVLFLENFD